MSFSMETERQNKFSFLNIEVFREQGKFKPQFLANLLLVACIVTLKVFYLLFINLL